MVYKYKFTKSAQKDLRRLDNKDAKRILQKMQTFLPDPFSYSKQLKISKTETPTFRFRVGDYRIVFRKDEKTDSLVILVVLKIKHRKEAYN